MNFTRWSARLPGTQRRAAARDDHSSVPAARAESVRPKPAATPPGGTPQAPPPRRAPAWKPCRPATSSAALPAPVALLHGPEHRITYVNAAYTSAFGPRPCGAPAAEAMPELAELSLLPLMDQVLRSGTPVRSSPARSAPVTPGR